MLIQPQEAKSLRACPCEYPLVVGGRNEEGLGDFIKRWEVREENPPPEQ